MNVVSNPSVVLVALLALGSASTASAQDEAAKPVAAKPAGAQDETAKAEPAKPETTFTPEKLEQIAAPIALYADSLLTQILMASTYPLEIVQAYRWVEKNKSVTGKALEEALKQQDWDPTVKSLCGLPQVLKQMNDNLDWTQDLGDAFLSQRAELLETVQKMRKKALEAGNLKSTEQQKVTQDQQVIVIESTSTEIVYVPTYSPTVVYGTWAYPTYYYPPMYVPPPPGYGLLTFGMGVAVGAAIWGNCNWHGNDVDINVNKYNNFNKNTNINPNRNNINQAGNNSAKWNHAPEHRQGVNYPSQKTAQQYGGAAAGRGAVTSDQARGYGAAATQASTRPAGSAPAAGAGGAGAAASNRQAGSTPKAGASTQPASPAASNRASGGGASGGTQRPASASPSTSASGRSGGSSALSGSRNPSADRSASSRGAASRGGGGGGGGRSGGGRGGGGGRR